MLFEPKAAAADVGARARRAAGASMTLMPSSSATARSRRRACVRTHDAPVEPVEHGEHANVVMLVVPAAPGFESMFGASSRSPADSNESGTVRATSAPPSRKRASTRSRARPGCARVRAASNAARGAAGRHGERDEPFDVKRQRLNRV